MEGVCLVHRAMEPPPSPLRRQESGHGRFVRGFMKLQFRAFEAIRSKKRGWIHQALQMLPRAEGLFSTFVEEVRSENTACISTSSRIIPSTTRCLGLSTLCYTTSKARFCWLSSVISSWFQYTLPGRTGTEKERESAAGKEVWWRRGARFHPTPTGED